MARKTNQQKSGLDRQPSRNKKRVSDSEGRGKASQVKVVGGEEFPNGNHSSSPTSTDCVGDETKNEQRSEKIPGEERQTLDDPQNIDPSMPCSGFVESISRMEASNSSKPNGTRGPKHRKSRLGYSFNRLHADNFIENLVNTDNLVVRRLRASAFYFFKAASEWINRQKPMFNTATTNLLKARDYVKMRYEEAYPIVLRWLMHFVNIMLLIFMVWLDCSLRGIDSFLRMGTTSFFSVVWCSIFSVVAMVGMTKFLMVLGLAALVGIFAGLTLAILVIFFSATVLLWLYGSFWTTTLVVLIGGLAFMLSHERVALLITTLYSVYCAWTYVGWLGLLLGLNLSFISSDALIYFLKNNMNEHGRSNRPTEQTTEGVHATFSETGPWQSTDRGPGVASTSGSDSEMASEDEVVRLLNCSDHYSALGFSRYENIDVSLLKREYRKKAMLVHPDKNMGNEKAAEAFKKLQNAYEVLLDSLKRKAYDDDLRREELLNYFRRFQNAPLKNGGHGFFGSGFARSESEYEDILGESRRIACKKCGNFHVWILTKKTKSRARWCQDCKDFHQAKDGDGWLEQSSQPFFFGMLQKIDAPSAYVCAESRIYDATEWYICQGMRCPVNSHKPSFHVNTSLTTKHNTGKANTAGQQRGGAAAAAAGGGGGMPTPNLDESMTEEEFLGWLQNAVQSGLFDNYAFGNTSTDSPSANAASNSPKSGGATNTGGSGSGSKKKKKGKKQW